MGSNRIRHNSFVYNNKYAYKLSVFSTATKDRDEHLIKWEEIAGQKETKGKKFKIKKNYWMNSWRVYNRQDIQKFIFFFLVFQERKKKYVIMIPRKCVYGTRCVYMYGVWCLCICVRSTYKKANNLYIVFFLSLLLFRSLYTSKLVKRVWPTG